MNTNGNKLCQECRHFFKRKDLFATQKGMLCKKCMQKLDIETVNYFHRRTNKKK